MLYFRLGERIHATLDTLRSQSLPPAKIILVDNASGDGVLDSIDANSPDVSIVRMETNAGYAGGMNAGAALAPPDCEAILFMTHEVSLDEDCLLRLATAMEEDRSLGMVGPALKLASNDSVWSLGGTITPLGDVRHNSDNARTDSVKWLDGACLLIRSDILQRCGGFDESYFLYWEDVDMSLRVLKHAKIRCVTEALAYQDTGTAPIYLRLRNQILCWRNNSAPAAVATSVLVAIAKLVLVDLRNGSWERLQARSLAILHGFTGQLASEPVRMLRN